MRKILCGVLLLLCGCGYTPVYDPEPFNAADGGVQQKMGDVYVSPLQERIGQQLRNALLDRGFGDNAQSKMTLTLVNLQDTEIDLGIAADNTATRRQLTLQASMRLMRDGQIIADRAVVSRATYNVLISQYGTIVSRDSAERQTIHDMARQIETHIALILSQGDP